MQKDLYTVYKKKIMNKDLKYLSDDEKMDFYIRTCERVGLSYEDSPFEYINLNGKLTLYITKAGTDQLRAINKVKITELTEKVVNDQYIVKAYGTNTKNGTTDCATGIVSIKGLSGDQCSNAMMKAETKSKRRLTLSLCGCGFLDESEIETIPDCQKVNIVTDTIKIKSDKEKELDSIKILEQFDAIKSEIKSKDTIECLNDYLSSIREQPIARNKDFNQKIKSLAEEQKKLINASSHEGDIK